MSNELSFQTKFTQPMRLPIFPNRSPKLVGPARISADIELIPDLPRHALSCDDNLLTQNPRFAPTGEAKVSKLLPGDCFQNCCRLGALQSEASIIRRHVLNTDIKIRFALQQRQISLGTARG